MKIVTVRTSSYTNSDHSEYLLIVSKEYGLHCSNTTNDTEGSDKRKVCMISYLFGFSKSLIVVAMT
jgi:hypothetical protein